MESNILITVLRIASDERERIEAYALPHENDISRLRAFLRQELLSRTDIDVTCDGPLRAFPFPVLPEVTKICPMCAHRSYRNYCPMCGAMLRDQIPTIVDTDSQNVGYVSYVPEYPTIIAIYLSDRAHIGSNVPRMNLFWLSSIARLAQLERLLEDRSEEYSFYFRTTKPLDITPLPTELAFVRYCPTHRVRDCGCSLENVIPTLDTEMRKRSPESILPKAFDRVSRPSLDVHLIESLLRTRKPPTF